MPAAVQAQLPQLLYVLGLRAHQNSDVNNYYKKQIKNQNKNQQRKTYLPFA